MNTLESSFGNKIRIRVCGILIKDDSLLLLNHKGLNKSNLFWAPPGGGVEFGEHATEALQREFKEETGLDVNIKKHLFTYEFISKPFHAVELFFEVVETGGHLLRGTDPELSEKNQIISDVKYLNSTELIKINDENKHGILARIKTIDDVTKLKGYIFN